jgi:acyl dehydratase
MNAVADKMLFDSAASVQASVGRQLGETEWMQITQERINQFADATGDHQWIHVDPEQARSGPFGACVAHGYLTLSLANLFLPQLVSYQGLKMGVNYGCEKVRFPAPVLVNSFVRGSGEVVAATPIGEDGVQVTIRSPYRSRIRINPAVWLKPSAGCSLSRKIECVQAPASVDVCIFCEEGRAANRVADLDTAAKAAQGATTRKLGDKDMKDAVIVSTARTPIGKAYRGAFNDTEAPVLGGHVIRAALNKVSVAGADVDDVILGIAAQQGTQGYNLGRLCGYTAGLPESVGGMVIDRMCASGLMSIATAAKGVMTGEMNIAVAGGLESISLVQNKYKNSYRAQSKAVLAAEPTAYIQMIETAELVSQRLRHQS